ncbi:MAG: phosphoribosylglycinamide formyltransferase [Oscillospiraceae bacterium]
MLKVAVLVSGGGTNLQAIIDGVQNKTIKNTQLVLVVSNVAGAYALQRAEKHNIPSAVLRKKDFETLELWEEALTQILEEKQVDLIVLAGFMSILSEKFTHRFENRIINVHPSLIPSFCGAGFYGLNVHKAVLEKGVKVTGATVHYVNGQVDGGKIIAQKAVEVAEGDTPETLQKRVMEQAEWIILPKAIDDIARKERP